MYNNIIILNQLWCVVVDVRLVQQSRILSIAALYIGTLEIGYKEFQGPANIVLVVTDISLNTMRVRCNNLRKVGRTKIQMISFEINTVFIIDHNRDL